MAGGCISWNLNVVADGFDFLSDHLRRIECGSCARRIVGDPYYRPQLTIPWWASGLGAAGCILAMFAINPSACLIAITLEILIFYGLSRKTLSSAFGDARSGLWLSMARFAVLRVRATNNPRNWRPNPGLRSKCNRWPSNNRARRGAESTSRLCNVDVAD